MFFVDWQQKPRRPPSILISSPYNFNMNRLRAVFLIAFITILMVACSTIIPQPTEDTTYLTPIPVATVLAFKSDGKINNKLQAAIIALGRSMEGHFGFIELPTVISVDKLTITEAHKRIASVYDDKGWSTDVWFVVLEGEIQIIPPPPPGGLIATLPPPFHGCNYELFGTNYPEGQFVLGGIPCPAKTP